MNEFTPPDWLKALGPYQIFVFLALALSPSLADWHAPPGQYDYWNQGLILMAIVFVSFIAARNNISGPLRYGIQKYGPWVRTIWGKSPEWTILALLFVRVLLPWTQTWLIGVVAIAWQYTYQHFREAVRNVTDQVNNICISATIAANKAREEAAAATRYELDALGAAATAIRDARQTQGIKSSDFFDEAMAAWAAVKRATDATSAACSHASTAVSSAESAYNSSRTTSSANCYNQSRAASGSLNDAHSHALSAQDMVIKSDRAQRQDTAAREQARRNARHVAGMVDQLTGISGPLPAAAARLIERAEVLRYEATTALAAAEEGRMEKANKLAAAAKSKLIEIEAEAKRIVAEKDKARRQLISQVLDKGDDIY
ncbi:MAG: hypothetical protein M1840_004996 [Geoglossum simile]|nr:MAG: hypothetical protein M1840_004996 [Geoglossum simile]